MKFFFDNNLSLSLAHAIRELCSPEELVREVVHLRDKFAPTTKDHDWIHGLASEGGWVIVSQDGFRKNDLEREALRKSGLIVFVLQRQWTGHRHWDKAHNLVRWWPAVMEQSRKIKGGAAFRIPWRYTGGGQFEQVRL